MDNVYLAFLLTTLAGLSTGIGSLIAFFTKQMSKKFLSLSLGFSAGVMVYVSMIDIFQKAQESLIIDLGNRLGQWVTILSFFGGMLLIAIIDKLIPSSENFHNTKFYKNSVKTSDGEKRKLMRMGIFTAIAIGIHNFPEGLATFMATLEDPIMALPIVIAIAIHNIPEGIAVSVPIYYATGSKWKAFGYSLFSGLTEPLGAILGWFILKPFMNDAVFGIIFAGVAGIMVFISLDQLLPSAREFGNHKLSIYGVISGMIVMAFSLLLLN